MSRSQDTSASSFQNANVVVSEARLVGEGSVVWELKNWNDPDNFNVLRKQAHCDVLINNNAFRFFLKVKKDSVKEEGATYKTETECVSLNVRKLLTLPNIYQDAAFTLKVTVEFLNEELLRVTSNLPGYKSISGSGITLSFESGRNLTEGKLVMKDFILLSQTSYRTHNGPYKSLEQYKFLVAIPPPPTVYEKPESLRYGIKVQLFSCAAQSSPKTSELGSPFQDFERMYEQQYNYSDLKLESRDGMLINTHKFVVAARSSKFRAIIEEETKRNDFSGTIKIGDVNAKPLMAILKWMYTGKMDDSPGKNLEELIVAGGTYEMDDLLKLYETKLIKVCNPMNMMELFQLARKHGMEDAAKEIKLFIKENIDRAI